MFRGVRRRCREGVSGMKHGDAGAGLSEDGEERRRAARDAAGDGERSVLLANAEIRHGVVCGLGLDGDLDVARVGPAGDGVEEGRALGGELFLGVDDSEDVIRAAGLSLGSELSGGHEVESIRSGFEFDFDTLDFSIW